MGNRALFCGGLIGLLWIAGGMGAIRSEARRFEFHNLRMGTEFRIVVWGDDELRVRRGVTEAFERADELEQIFSDYRLDSEISTVESLAAGRACVVSPLLFQLLDRSLHFSRLTDGAFDITVGPAVRLWRRSRGEGRLPSTAELERVRARIGYRKVLLNPRTRSLRLSATGMQLDLGGIAKGFAADEMLRVLELQGLNSCLVDAGGDLRLGSAPPSKEGWSVRLEDDLNGDRQLSLSDCAVATSGDRLQFVEIDGVRYSHIVDPRSGLGLRHHGVVTVLAPDAVTADALATGLSVMEVADGIRLVEGLQGVDVRISRGSDGGKTLARSSGFPP